VLETQFTLRSRDTVVMRVITNRKRVVSELTTTNLLRTQEGGG